ncbi:DoxX family protein [Corynebacterium sphenisci]|uniref:DoxX family protein n=1 Tax=Corynebacterium sphenisci TaxID=191493 RepID=UPI0026DEB918|nr:DoxX family protein [Corynebacterium sphenisci]MDO5731104.1 DoxX family protein [Corynebacterium sphenisci]
MNRQTSHDVALLVLRLGLGIVFIAHGWHKLFFTGPEALGGMFAKSGVPLAGASAWFTAVGELVCGVLLLIGLLTRIAAGVLLFIMVGAYVFVHFGTPLVTDEGGAQLVVVIIAALVVPLLLGPGRISLHHLIRAARTPAPAKA